jgi:hypothetical protein
MHTHMPMANVQAPNQQPKAAQTQYMQSPQRLPVTPIVDVEPKFIEHLSRYKGKTISVSTTIGKLEGVMEDAFIDHLALVMHGKKAHVRYDQIVYFE